MNLQLKPVECESIVKSRYDKEEGMIKTCKVTKSVKLAEGVMNADSSESDWEANYKKRRALREKIAYNKASFSIWVYIRSIYEEIKRI